jgi:peptidoglycan/LPS O-acetylase OafA/YrhL
MSGRYQSDYWFPSKTENSGLTGLRAVAALLVYLTHASSEGLLPGSMHKTPIGESGVMLFFALSGFLMAALYLRQDFTWFTVRSFVTARFARIYPLFAVVVLASALWFRVDHGFIFNLTGRKTLEHLLLAGDGLTLWTISVEFQFYAAFVGLCAIYAVLPRNIRDLGLGALCVGLIIMLAVLGFPGGRIAITHYAHFFLVGCLAAIVVWNVAPVKWGADLVLAILFGSLLLSVANLPPLTPEANSFRFLPLLIITGAIVLFVANGTGIIADRFLGSKVMVYLGEVSFGLYLLHRPTFYLWLNVLGIKLHWTLMFLLVTVTVICFAHLAHICIERPARALLRGAVVPVLVFPVNWRSWIKADRPETLAAIMRRWTGA